MPQNIFVGRAAEGYDFASAEMYEPSLLASTVDFLLAEAYGGPALELGIGTGRVALPLRERGIDVHGIDISADMIDQLRKKPGADAITTTVGDFATVTVPRTFSLVYVVFNSISNLLEQDEWVACFRNAARHLRPGGRFLLELWIPTLRNFPPGALGVPFEIAPDHVGFDTIDPATQRGVSHHYFTAGDSVGYFPSPFRYAWPAELDLMAQLAGLQLRERVGDWDRSTFTSESTKHISVWEKPEPTRVFHLALESEWRAAIEAGTYTTSTLGRTLEEVGFVHASFAEQVDDTFARYYARINEPVVVLEIDTARLGVPIVVEPAAEGGEMFPHIYGPIPVGAVVAVRQPGT